MTVNPETLPDITKDPRAVLAIKAALKEDIGAGDATTLALVGPDILAPCICCIGEFQRLYVFCY